MTNRATVVLCALFLLAATLACGNGEYATPRPATAPAVTSSALQPTIEHLEVERYADAIRAEEAARIAHATLTAHSAQATATAQAVLAEREELAFRHTLEAAAHQATSTAVAHSASATAVAEHRHQQATATAAVEAARATATTEAARATATVAAVLFEAQATETAVARQFSIAGTTEAHAAWSTIQAAEAEKAHRDAERERITAPLRAWGPWALATLGVIVALLAFGMFWDAHVRTYELRHSAIYRDPNGAAPIILVNPRRRLQSWNADTALNPLNDLGHDAPRYALPDQETQREVKRANQLAAIARGGPQARALAHREMERAPGFQILAPGQRPPAALIDAATLAELDAKWEEN